MATKDQEKKAELALAAKTVGWYIENKARFVKEPQETQRASENEEVELANSAEPKTYDEQENKKEDLDVSHPKGTGILEADQADGVDKGLVEVDQANIADKGLVEVN